MGRPVGRPDPGATAQQPRMTRAEMRRAAQNAGRRGGRGTANGMDGGPGRRANRHPPKNRLVNYPRWDKSGIMRWLPSWQQVAGLFVIFLGGLTATVLVSYNAVGVPDPNKFASQQNNIFYWSDGSVMATDGQTNRQIVPLSDINTSMQNAVISAENHTFWQDSGIDPKGIARAVFNMATGGDTQGGSTITQQYVKNTYLTQQQTLSRKFKEMFIALKLDKTKSKQDILDGYLNTSWFGRNSYGVEAAAKAYYNEDAKDLTPCQSAMLAGLLKGAGLYDPSLSPGNHARSVARWKWILDQMVKWHHLSPAQESACLAKGFPEPVKLRLSNSLRGQVGYLVDLAKGYAGNKLGMKDQDWARGGYRVYTTFNKRKTAELEKSVKDIYKKNFDPKKRPDTDKYMQFGAASVKPGDGAIVAVYGGSDYIQHPYDNANSDGVPVGSTFKPFVLAAAMKYGVKYGDMTERQPINPKSRYLGNDLIPIKNPDGSYVLDKDNKPFRQKNEDSTKWGYISLRTAMQYSVNSPFVQLGMYVGLDNVAQVAMDNGLLRSSLAYRNPSFSIGTSTPSAIRMADAYATFAARGVQADPYSVTKVVHDGEVLKGLERPQTRAVMSPAVADNVTDVLRTVVQKGTGTRAKALGRPAAGKTGTTDDSKSAWFVGYTPQLATAVAMFRGDPAKGTLLSMQGAGGKAAIYGGDFPTEVWTEYMRAALAGVPVEDFTPPGPVGTQLDEQGAPSTASPTPSATAPKKSKQTAAPTATATSPKCRHKICTSPTPTYTSGTTGLPGWIGGQSGSATPTDTATASASGPPGKKSSSGGLLGG